MNNGYNDLKQYNKTIFSIILTKQYNVQQVQQKQWPKNNVDNYFNIKTINKTMKTMYFKQ